MLQKRENWIGYAFLLPSLIGFIVLKLYPVLFSLFLSFCEWDLISGWDKIKFIGIQNFINMLDDRYVVSSFSNTLRYVLMVVPGQLVIGIVVAVILEKCVFFKRYFYHLLYALHCQYRCGFGGVDGNVSSSIARSIAYSRLLVLLNLPAGYPAVTGNIIALMSIWTGSGYNIVVNMAALQGIPSELYEAAKIDGASGFQSFRHITIPLLFSTTFFLMLIKIIGTFQVFGPVKLMTKGGPGRATMVIVYEIYREAFQYYKIGYASAQTLVLFVIIMLVTLVQMKLQKKWVYQY